MRQSHILASYLRNAVALLRAPAELGLAIGGALVLAACGQDSAGNTEPLHHEFPKILVGAGAAGETEQWCQSWTLDNEEPIYVNAITMANDGGFHHSNWFWVKDDMYDGPDGTWPCAERMYDQSVASLAGGVVFAQSTQASGETLGFVDGAAYKIEPHSRIVGGLHLFNPGEDPIETGMTFDIQPIPKPDVLLNPAVFAYYMLDIPGNNTRSRFQGTCDLEAAYGAPLDFSFYYMLPHYHRLGMKTELTADMPSGPTSVFGSNGTIGEAKSVKLDPPFDARGAGKLTFSCDYFNPTPTVVHWGNTAADEMCILVSFTDSQYTITNFVYSMSEHTGTQDGVEIYQGPCGVGFLPHY